MRSCVVVIGGGEEKEGEGMERKGRDGKRSNGKNERENQKGRMVHQVRQYSGILLPLLSFSRLYLLVRKHKSTIATCMQK